MYIFIKNTMCTNSSGGAGGILVAGEYLIATSLILCGIFLLAGLGQSRGIACLGFMPFLFIF